VKDQGRDQPRIEESLDFAYFLGVILGDSSISKDGIMFSPRDSEFKAKIIRIGTEIIGKEPTITHHKQYGKPFERIHFYSLAFLHELGLWLNFNESLLKEAFSSRSTYSHPEAFIKIYDFVRSSAESTKAFIEGFYDSEGCCSIWQSLQFIEMWNTNKDLLGFIQKLLLDYFKIESKMFLGGKKGSVHFSATGKPITRSKDCWRLRIGKKDSVNTFANSIQSSIPRKNPKIETWLPNFCPKKEILNPKKWY
jgi:hypothetical protein